MKSLYIYCAGGAGKETCDVAEIINLKNRLWKEIIFIDDIKKEDYFYNKKCLSYEKFKQTIQKHNAEIIIATGEPHIRKILFEKVKKDGYSFANIISDSSVISPSAQIGKGVIIQSFCQISANTIIEDNVFLNYSCVVGHDCMIKKNSFLSVRTGVLGGSTIGENCFFGAGSILKDHITVNDWCVVGMNSVVTKNIESEKIVIGIPAKVVKDNIDKKVFK